EKAKQLIKLVHLPQQYFHPYPAQFSAGQQQPIGVVPPLPAQQDIILIHEPFPPLHPITPHTLQHLLNQLQQKLPKTFIFLTHHIHHPIKLPHKISIMSKPKVLQYHTPH
ncbi:P-loop NTPase family protein, partial [Staphylococcus epidermidis]